MFDTNPADEDPHLECNREIKELQKQLADERLASERKDGQIRRLQAAVNQLQSKIKGFQEHSTPDPD